MTFGLALSILQSGKQVNGRMNMKSLLLCAILVSGCAVFEPYEFPPEDYDTAMLWAADNTEPTNCLIWARAVQLKMATLGEKSEIYAIELYPQDHAIICNDSFCADNGTLMGDRYSYFDKSELLHYNITGQVFFVGQKHILIGRNQ